MISIQNVSKSYGDKKALSNTSFDVNAGEIFALIGHNGAGKTTLIKMICGILDFEDGEILINDKSIKTDPIECKKELAYVPDNPELYEDMKAKILPTIGEYELVFVDDGSGDSSWEIMNQIKAMDDNVHLVKLSRNFGEHAALLAGLSVCTGDCAVTKQADLQEDSTLILEMYESWKRGNKVVLAVRRSRDESR